MAAGRDTQTCLREQRSCLSNASAVAEPIDYMLRRWDRFARFIDDGRICLTNNAAERALRGFALGRKPGLFAGSGRGADRAAALINDSKAQRHRSASVARRRARTDRQYSTKSDPRAAALAMEDRTQLGGSLTGGSDCTAAQAEGLPSSGIPAMRFAELVSGEAGHTLDDLRAFGKIRHRLNFGADGSLELGNLDRQTVQDVGMRLSNQSRAVRLKRALTRVCSSSCAAHPL